MAAIDRIDGPHSEPLFASFRRWLTRLTERRDRRLHEPGAPAGVRRDLRSDWQTTANDRMTDDGAPPPEPGSEA